MLRTVMGTFDIEMTPGSSEIGGAVGRFDFTKVFHGDFEGTGIGVMLSCGDPQTGEAGYVAIEILHGRLGDAEGSFGLQQLGLMHGGSQALYYKVVPGSGDGSLKGITGILHLTVEDDGTHRYELECEI